MSGDRMHIQHPMRKTEMLCGLPIAEAGPEVTYGDRGFIADGATPLEKPEWCARCRAEIMRLVPLAVAATPLPVVIPTEGSAP